MAGSRAPICRVRIARRASASSTSSARGCRRASRARRVSTSRRAMSRRFGTMGRSRIASTRRARCSASSWLVVVGLVVGSRPWGLLVETPEQAERRRARRRRYERMRRAADPAWAERERERHRVAERARRAGDPRYSPIRRGNPPSKFKARPLTEMLRRKEWAAERRRQVVSALLDLYGAVCACCGEAGRRFLTIDHVENDGHVERRGGRSQFLWKVQLLARTRRKGLDARYRVLCFNCNLARESFGRCHDDGPLAHEPPPRLSPSRRKGVEHGARGAAPRPSQEQLPFQTP